MKVKNCFFVLFFLLISQIAISQSAQTRFMTGKNLLKKEKYQAAIEALKPLLSESEDNPYVEYAHYFYGLALLKEGKTEEARQIVKQLLLKFPNWKQEGEARYLLGSVLFEQGKYKDALDALKGLDKDFKKDSEKLKEHYLAKVDNLESLRWLHQNFPKDKQVAKAYAREISIQTDNEKDEMLLNYLIEEYSLSKADFAGDKITSEKKDEYNIAVLFPFMVDRLPVENVNRPNQFLLDMYQGIKIAADSLRKEGLKVNVYAFDTEKDVEKFKALLDGSEIKDMDLIIGPVYTAHLPVISDFSKKHQIQVVSPFSYDLSIIEENPFMYLFQPAYQYQSEQLARHIMKKHKPFVEFVKKESEKGKGKGKDKEVEEIPVLNNKVVIFYGDTEKDSVMAASYKSALLDSTGAVYKKDTSFQITHFEKVTRENVGRIKEVLTDSSLMTKVNHVFIASDDQVVAANVMSSTEISGFDVPVFTTSDWLSFDLITIDQFERRNVHFLHPAYLDYEKTAVANFKEEYLDKTRIYPTTFAYQGYDIMYLFGKMLQSYGTYFGEGVKDAGFIPGNTLSGFNYEEAQSNRYVPIVKFVNGKLEVVNTVLAMERK